MLYPPAKLTFFESFEAGRTKLLIESNRPIFDDLPLKLRLGRTRGVLLVLDEGFESKFITVVLSPGISQEGKRKGVISPEKVARQIRRKLLRFGGWNTCRLDYHRLER